MLGAIASFFCAIGTLISWLTGYEQRKAGAQAQQLADEKGTVNEADAARKVEAGNAGRSADDLRASLLRDSSRD